MDGGGDTLPQREQKTVPIEAQTSTSDCTKGDTMKALKETDKTETPKISIDQKDTHSSSSCQVPEKKSKAKDVYMDQMNKSKQTTSDTAASETNEKIEKTETTTGKKQQQQQTEINTDKTASTKSPTTSLDKNSANDKHKEKTSGKERKAIIEDVPTVEDDASTAGDESLSPVTQSQPATPTQANATSAATIPENILSPPKSETQTDDTNTATSSSPESDSQLSPGIMPGTTPTTTITTETGEKSPKGVELNEGNVTATATSASTPVALTPIQSSGTRVVQPINVVANGTIPKSAGKPLMSAMNKKLNKPTRSTRPRKQKVAMYESEISDNKIGIKLCIKKSDTSSTTATVATAAATPVAAKTAATPTTATKQTKKRSRKSKTRTRLDSDDSEYEIKRKKDRGQNNNGERQKKVSFSAGTASGAANDIVKEPVQQGIWGEKLPEEVLFQIFQLVVEREGCLPTLFRLGRVCSLWRRVSLSPTLWKTMDLSTWIKEKYRTELKLKWFVDNRCSSCTELNVSNWKISDINCFLTKLAKGCPNLIGITLSGWKGFTSDHLTFLVDNLKKLQRLDLSSVNVEMNASKSAVGLQSLCNALQTMNGRLTHLHLAHNRLAGIPQIVTILSTHCPNLMLLDLSNVTTQATSHGILHIEKLQNGCQKLRVLRVTNSHVTLSTATMQEMMDSLGFPELEELSVAALTDESRVMGDEHLQRILKTSSKLKLLDVRGCTRLTHESLIRLPAWDIKHLYLSGCSVTRDVGSGLELIASKWAHSLNELDLAWANVQQPLDNALRALAEKGSESPLAHLNLCGSSVSDEAVKDILANCAHMSSINLSSCRGLPRGVKRLMQGPQELQELRDVLRVQMKVKLPAQLKQEQEAAAAAAAALKMETQDGDGAGGGGGGGESGGSSQSN